MKRRFFIVSGVLGVSGLGLYEYGLLPGQDSAYNFWSLPSNIQELHDAHFSKALGDKKTSELVEYLIQSGVIEEQAFMIETLKNRLFEEALIEYEHKLYSQSELYLYCLVARLKANSITSLFRSG